MTTKKETKYRVTSTHGEVVANMEELYQIAYLWIDDWNEEELEEDKMSYPSKKDDLDEILEEYMECVVEKIEETEEETVESKYIKLTLN